jgi:uncharacterized protein (TIGR03382 family)
VLLCLAGTARAQDLPDASLPDASVGAGGADHTSEENDPAGACLASSDCDRGFTCRSGRCVYSRIIDATFTGCEAAGPGLLGGVLGLAALGWSRRRRRAGPG